MPEMNIPGWDYTRSYLEKLVAEVSGTAGKYPTLGRYDARDSRADLWSRGGRPNLEKKRGEGRAVTEQYLTNRHREEWLEQVRASGSLGLARRLLARQRELETFQRNLASEIRSLDVLVQEAYELAGYERQEDGGFAAKSEPNTREEA